MPLTTSGQYGGIPSSILRYKYEKTNIQEPQTNEYFRDALRDTSCDLPFFESDQKREDTHAEEFLALRHTGHRTGEVPDAPDMFLELTDFEPRGTAVDPDMRRVTDSSWERGTAGSYKFYSDVDNTVTESERPPWVVYQQMREAQDAIKNYAKIFSTSKEGFHPSRGVLYDGSSRGDMVDSIAGLTLRQELFGDNLKRNYTTLLSNKLPLGWEQTGDHEFSVAQYGQQRGRQLGEDPEAILHKTSAEPTPNTAVFSDMIVTSGLAQTMKQIVEGQKRAEVDGEWKPTKSVEQTNTQARLIGPKGEDQTEQAQQYNDSVTRIEHFIGQLNRQGGVAAQPVEREIMLIKNMESTARKQNGLTAKFTADNIVALLQNTTMADTQAKAQSSTFSADPLARRQTNLAPNRFESMSVARLGRADRNARGEQLTKSLIGEQYKRDSFIVQQKAIKRPDTRDPYQTLEEQAHSTFHPVDRHTGGLKSKFTRDKMESDSAKQSIAGDF